MNDPVELALFLLAATGFAGAARAVWKVWRGDEGLTVPPPNVAPPAGLHEPPCAKPLRCGHACRCAEGHDRQCCCWRIDCTELDDREPPA